MALSPGFSDYVLELLSGFGGLESKRLFGGAGIYRNGVMFALLDDDAVYFRVDDELQVDLKSQGSEAWVYSMKRDGVVRDMGYWRMPETAADDPDEAVAIARRSYAAALKRQEIRAKPKKRAVKSSKKAPVKKAATKPKPAKPKAGAKKAKKK